MALRIVRLGTPRLPSEGLRLGTVRRLPRGVRKDDYARRDYFDVWLPDLAPSAELFASAREGPLDGPRWDRFARAFRREMRAPPAQRLIAVLAALSHRTDLSVGCYCEDEAHCHRSLLREAFAQAGAAIDDSHGDASSTPREPRKAS
jgi:uncharacterized protein YeaO (DUF488 family)